MHTLNVPWQQKMTLHGQHSGEIPPTVGIGKVSWLYSIESDLNFPWEKFPEDQGSMQKQTVLHFFKGLSQKLLSLVDGSSNAEAAVKSCYVLLCGEAPDVTNLILWNGR